MVKIIAKICKAKGGFGFTVVGNRLSVKQKSGKISSTHPMTGSHGFTVGSNRFSAKQKSGRISSTHPMTASHRMSETYRIE